MSTETRLLSLPGLFLAAIALSVVFFAAVPCLGQDDGGNNGGNDNGGNTLNTGDTLAISNIGGVRIDAKGVLSSPTINAKQLQRIRQRALAAVDADLNAYTDLRFVSLRKLAERVEESRQKGSPLPDEIRFLAGLQRVQYVLAMPKSNDIILGGPAEGWKADRLGNIVGVTTGRPVLLLDDLIVALQVYGERGGVATCSIDPTPEGMQRLRAVVRQLRPNDSAKTSMRRIEKALGPQTITIEGIDDTTHFARVMIAADYRMKRIAMKFEPAPISGLPSYFDMMKYQSGGMSNIFPRWWLAPSFDALHTDGDKLSWEIRGPGVQCMTEDTAFASDGRATTTGRSSKAAQRWADTMTAKYGELADHDSTFAQLRNLMDLAVVAALIGQEQLEQRGGVDLSGLASATLSERYQAPQQVATQASLIRKGGKRLVSASGGVEVSPWKAVEQAEQADLTAIHSKATPSNDAWWWQ